MPLTFFYATIQTHVTIANRAGVTVGWGCSVVSSQPSQTSNEELLPEEEEEQPHLVMLVLYFGLMKMPFVLKNAIASALSYKHMMMS